MHAVRLSIRFVVPLVLVLALLAAAVMPLVDRLTFRWFVKDLDLRASLVANTVDAPIQGLSATNDVKGMRAFFARITQDERLFAMGYCGSDDLHVVGTPTLPSEVRCESLEQYEGASGHLVRDANGPLLISVRPLRAGGDTLGRIILVHDLSFAERRSAETKQYLFYFFVGLGALVSLITVVVAHLSWRGWIQGIRSLLHGDVMFRSSRAAAGASSGDLQPIADDLRALIRDLEAEHRLRDEEQLTWTPETLRGILNRELRGHDVIVVSNREPYIHVREGGAIVIQRPASGLVTAVEPIMRACSGTWIAHGSGSADHFVVDEHDRVAAPVGDPGYVLRRIWLTAEEEQGYYYGFSNEGLWPLSHIAHVRPTFRSVDWVQYERVNRRFAEAVIEEARSADPIVLVQDYHLALVPRMIRERLPNATIITFWHIPWPNPEAFAICPWREQLLDGLLGSSILGFHTQFHCNNFVDTVDRQLEARVDRETFGVSYHGQRTMVKRYPISVEWPPAAALVARPVDECRASVRERLGLPADHALGIGVDRLDYTKGIEERFHALERMLELHPEWIGRFTFVQVAAPTRASIEQYRHYEQRVRAVADRINARFGTLERPAIALVVQHHDAEEVYAYYRAADLCFVSSLHDGMNLVAKEFVAARDDERGVLVLSQFTGAARELPEAIIVNPYDADQCAAALELALTMPLRMQRARMRLMRGLIHEFNVYRWAGRMLLDAATMRRGMDFAGRPTVPVKRTRATDAPFAAQPDREPSWSSFAESVSR
jgi:trehalose 6-phosphate synthase